MNVLSLFRGYVINTGQEFVNTRGADSNAQPLEFDSGMGILPEAIDMTGTDDDCNKQLYMQAYTLYTQTISKIVIIDIHHSTKPRIVICSSISH